MTVSETIASAFEEKCTRFPTARRSPNCLGLLIGVDGDCPAASAAAALRDLGEFLEPLLPRQLSQIPGEGQIRFNCNGEDFTPFLPHLWAAIMTWCGDRGHGAVCRWHEGASQPQEIDARVVQPEDVLLLLKVTHRLHLQLSAQSGEDEGSSGGASS